MLRCRVVLLWLVVCIVIGMSRGELPVHELCPVNDTVPWVSWCNYVNPTIVPLPFDLKFDEVIPPYPFCDNPNDIYSHCTVIDNIAVIQKINTESPDGIDRILYFSSPTGCVSWGVMGQSALRSSCQGTMVTNMDTFIPPSAGGNFSYISIGQNGDKGEGFVNIYVLHANVEPFYDADTTMFFDLPLVKTMFMSVDSNNGSAIAVSILKAADDDYYIDFQLIASRMANSFAYIATHTPLATWRLLNTSQSVLDFDVTPLFTDFVKHGNNTGFSQTSNILLVYDNSSVNLIRIFGSNVQDATIQLGPNSGDISTYYVLPPNSNATIDIAHVYAEQQQRSPDILNPYPSSLLWVFFGLSYTDPTDPTDPTDLLNPYAFLSVAFPEYVYANSQNGKLNSTTIRPMFSIDLSEKPSHIEARFVPQYEEYQMDMFTKVFSDDNSYFNTPHTEIFVALQRTMAIFSSQVYSETQAEVLFESLNNITYAGSFESVFVSANAQHVIVATTRFLWELQSMERFYNICTTLQNTSESSVTYQFLEPYQSQCDTQGYRNPDYEDFMQYAGVCPNLLQCPSFDELIVNLVPRGYYSQNSFMIEECEPGYFCMQGMQQDCPKGFICPDYGMGIPQRCEFDPLFSYTCYGDNLLAPIPCAAGMSCPTPYFPPFPSPPGYCMGNTTSKLDFTQCTAGDYCSLGMSCISPNRPCPLGTYCPVPDVMTPTVCSYSIDDNYCSYCEAGSWEEKPCPAGNECSGPNTTAPCQQYQYCPSGTLSALLCPAGYYCPDSATEVECPAGSYCPQGSMSPKKCSLFSVCHKGSASEKGNYGMPLFGAITILLLYASYKTYAWYTSKQPKKATVEKKSEETQLLYTPAVEGLQQKAFRIDIEFSKLGLTIGKKTVLSGVTGTIHSGRVTAVMGPSGAGKTTFLTTLADKVATGKVTGGIYINGKKGSLGEFKEIVGFVPQEDIMLRTMTVEEILLLAARTRLPAGMSDTLRQTQVSAVIDVLGLKDVKGSIIGDEVTRGVSGGQRKRVNIGMELVADPTVLFLDEPTSGLDSTSSREVLAALRKIAELGITIVTVIHQPRYEIFTMFHDVLLLGKGGKTVYLGASSRALEYFEMLGFKCPPLVNPPDFFLDVISGEVEREGHPDFQPVDLFDLWIQHKDNFTAKKEEEKNDSSSSTDIESRSSIFSCLPKDKEVTYRVIPGFFTQFWLFFLRSMMQQFRGMQAVALDMMLVASSGLFLGIIFANTQYQGPPSKDLCSKLLIGPLITRCLLPLDDPISTIASLTCLSVALTAVASALRVFGNEKVVYWREASWGLNTTAYFLGKDVAQIPSMLLQPLIFLAVYSIISSTQAPFGDVFFVILLVQFCAVGIGYLVSIMIDSSLSQLVGVVFVLVSMMFSGARPTLQELSEMIFPLPIMPYFSFIRWAQEAFYLTEIKEYKDVYNVQTGLDIWSYKFSNLKLDVTMVIVLGVAFRIIALILLYVMNRHKKK